MPKYQHNKPTGNRNFIYITAFVTVLGLLLVIAAVFLNSRNSPVPESIKNQVSFIVYVPRVPWHSQQNSFRYSQTSGVLSFSATQNNTKLTFTEQAAPSQFNDIPQFYPTLLDKLNQYQSIGTVNGTVNLVHPTELKGKQQAVLSNNGTLVFVNPSKDLTADEWRKLFNNMQLIR